MDHAATSLAAARYGKSYIPILFISIELPPTVSAFIPFYIELRKLPFMDKLVV
ncbi:hypothetical protein ApAK_07365 [Thermoplasmatales archaeon AK]|nr:hypothetical protein [Thermoplasmatales archaeon AK]